MDLKMGASYFLLLLIPYGLAQVCPTTAPTSTIPITLYSIGEPGNVDYAHVISSASGFSMSPYTPKVEYVLDAESVAQASTECPQDCLIGLETLYKISGTDNSDVVLTMCRPGEEAGYPGFSDSGAQPVYCVMNKGDCGATVPLYLYYDAISTDYYVSTDGGGPTNDSDPYPFATVAPYVLPAVPLCYGWEILMSTTADTTMVTEMTTPMITDLTSIEVSVSTTEILALTDEYGSTLTSIATTPGSISDGTSDPDATTVSGQTSDPYETTQSSSDSNSTTTTASRWEKFKSKWWRWPLITIGVLIACLAIVSLIACLTKCFISPAAEKSTRVSYSPDTSSQQVLPPQPLDAAPSGPQPLTVGFPSGAYGPPPYAVT